MITFAWNYTPNPELTKTKRIVQAWIDFRRKDLADANDVWHEWRWENRHIAFYVDGKRASPKEAAERLRECPAIAWAFPYHYTSVGVEDFSPEAVVATEELVAQTRRMLRNCGKSRLSEKEMLNVYHVLDFENDGPHIPDRFGRMPTNVPHLATACYLFSTALRLAGWGERMANYNTNHRVERKEFGQEPYFRSTPYHIPASLDQRTIFSSGYTSGGPQGCLTEEEMWDVILKAGSPLWLALDDYQPGLENLIRLAKEKEVELIGFWGSGRENKEFSDEQDKKIHAAINS